MNVGEHIVRFSGKATIDRPLELEHDYDITSTMTCTKKDERPNGDGTMDVTFTLEPVITEITSEKGNRQTAKRKGSQSQVQRLDIIMELRDTYPDVDEDAGYKHVMAYIIARTPSLVKLAMESYVQGVEYKG